jgi:hypothetical protein
VRSFIVSLFATLALIVGGLTVAVPAQADSTSTTVSAEVVKSAPNLTIPQVAPKSNSVPKVIGGGVIRPFWLTVGCYLAMDGYTWCYRYACTTVEYWLMGCRDGWYRVPRYWYA